MRIRRTMLMCAAAVMLAGLAEPARAISRLVDPETEAGRLAVNAEPVVKLIDARDLASVLPAVGGRSSMMAVTELVLGIGRSLELKTEPLADGVFTVTGEAAKQEQFVTLLEAVRALYNGKYDLELACYSVPATTPPEIGAAATVDGAPIRIRQAVTRRVETKVQSSKTVTAIVKWQPVVADNSVGYDAQTDKMDAGLLATVLVGAGSDVGDMVDVRLRIEISDVELREMSVPLLGEEKGGLPLQLPTISRRVITADTRVGAEPRVVGVMPGLKAGEMMVIAASVKQVKR